MPKSTHPWLLAWLLLGLPKPYDWESASVRKGLHCLLLAFPEPLLDFLAGSGCIAAHLPEIQITISKGSKVQCLLFLGTFGQFSSTQVFLIVKW